MRTPLARMLLSFEVGWVSTRSLLLFMFAHWILLSLLTERWALFPTYWIASGTSTSVITLGVVLNTLMKIALLSEDIVLGPSALLGSYDSSNIFHSILKSSDIFSLWYLVLLSLRISRLYEERSFLVVALSATCWLILLLSSFVFGFRYSFIF